MEARSRQRPGSGGLLSLFRRNPCGRRRFRLVRHFHFSSLCPNNAFFLFISSFLCGAGICILGKSIPFLQADFVIIGDIMLLVPGIAITTAARDMVIGDTISGATRLVESLLGAATLACGFMLAMLMLGR